LQDYVRGTACDRVSNFDVSIDAGFDAGGVPHPSHLKHALLDEIDAGLTGQRLLRVFLGHE